MNGDDVNRNGTSYKENRNEKKNFGSQIQRGKIERHKNIIFSPLLSKIVTRDLT